MSGHRTHQTYKEVCIPWVGKIPEHWGFNPLFAVASECKYKNKGMVEKNLLSLSYGRIIKKDINSGEGLLPESFDTYQIVEKNDIVFRLTDLQNDWRSLRSAIVPERGIITSAYIAVRSKELKPEFLNYLMRAYDIQKVFYSMGGGIRQSLKFEDLRRLPLVTPPKQEQEQICIFLDRETSRIDTLIAKRIRFIELLTEKIQSTVMLAISAKENPLIRLANLCSVISRPVKQQATESYIRLGVLNKGRGLFKREETDTADMGDSDFFWIEKNDLILSGQFAWEGAVAMADAEHAGCVVSHRFPIIRGNLDVVLTEYLLAFFMTQRGNYFLNDSSRGSAGRNRPLNMNYLLKQKIPVVAMSIQCEVARLINLRKKLTDKSDIQIRLLRQHRSALITAAVTGKIDIRETT